MVHFNWFELLPFPPHVSTILLSTTLLLIAGIYVRLSLKKSAVAIESPTGTQTLVAPAQKFGLHGIFELIIEFIDDFVVKIIGKSYRKLTPIFASVFLIIFFNNLIGLFPGMTPATENLNTTLAMGLVSFVFYNYLGFKEHGFGYLKQFLGPVWFLVPVFLILEVVAHLVRPASLGIRLWGNMMGDHVVLGIFLDLTSYFGLPIVFYGLGFFVCLMQAFVFTILSITYVGLAVSHDH